MREIKIKLNIKYMKVKTDDIRDVCGLPQHPFSIFKSFWDGQNDVPTNHSLILSLRFSFPISKNSIPKKPN